MTEYFFSKYYVERKCTPYGNYYEGNWEYSSDSLNSWPLRYMENTYSFNSYDGTFSTTTGVQEFVTLSRKNTHYYTSVDGVYLYREEHVPVPPDRVKTTVYRKRANWRQTGETCRDVRGSYIGKVKGALNQYPRNGVQGGYWYVRGGEASSPYIISPSAGDTVSYLTEITWDSTTSIPSGFERFWIQISVDGGSNWEDVVRLGELDYKSGSYIHDFNKYGQTSQAKLRVFFTVNGEMTYPNETQGVFTIIPNEPPERPKVKEGDIYFQKVSNEYKIQWEFVDNDLPQGDYQTKAEITVKRGRRDVASFTQEGEKKYFLLPLKGLETGYEYDIEVHTYDRMGLKSKEGSKSHFIFVTDIEYSASIIRHEIDTEKKLHVSFETGFTVDKGIAYLYNEEGEEIESVANISDGENQINFESELKNLNKYKVLVEFYAIEKDKEGVEKSGKSSVITYEFIAMFRPPPKPSISWEPTDKGILLKPELVFEEGEPEPVRVGVMKYVNGEWITLSENVDGTYEDRFTKSGKTLYRAVAYDAEGSFSFSDSIEADFHLEFPVLTNLRTFETLRVTDIIKFEYSNKPDTAYHRILSRNSLLAEVGEYVERRISMSWEVYDIPNLIKFREFLNSEDLFLFRDREGRYLRISVEDFFEDESYNPHMFTLSIEGINVGEV